MTTTFASAKYSSALSLTYSSIFTEAFKSRTGPELRDCFVDVVSFSPSIGALSVSDFIRFAEVREFEGPLDLLREGIINSAV